MFVYIYLSMKKCMKQAIKIGNSADKNESLNTKFMCNLKKEEVKP